MLLRRARQLRHTLTGVRAFASGVPETMVRDERARIFFGDAAAAADKFDDDSHLDATNARRDERATR